MADYLLLKAYDGRIGPNAYVETFVFHNYDDATDFMIQDINDEGGGEWSEDFGNGYSENGYVYDIFNTHA